MDALRVNGGFLISMQFGNVNAVSLRMQNIHSQSILHSRMLTD